MKFRLLIFILLFCFLPLTKVQAKLELINVDYYKMVTMGGLTVTLSSFDPAVRQWVVELTPKDGYQQLAVYPNNKVASFTVKSPQVWEYQLPGESDWQNLAGQVITAQAILLRPGVNDNQNSVDDVVLNLKPDQATITPVSVTTTVPDLQLLSGIYQIDSSEKKYQIKFHYQDGDNFHKEIYRYDASSDSWQALPTYNDVEEKFLSTEIKNQEQPLVIAIWSDNTKYDGIASYYNQAWYKSFHYKNGDFAASTIYPKGTKLKVTRLLTGKSVIVTVNDYGPEGTTNRLIDLDISAFKKIASTRAGLIYVKVEPYDQTK